jgi:hypothetical protein
MYKIYIVVLEDRIRDITKNLKVEINYDKEALYGMFHSPYEQHLVTVFIIEVCGLSGI